MEQKKSTTLHDKLLNVQQKLKAPKNQVNQFGKYKYRSCEDILEAVKKLLGEEGLVLTISDEPIVLGDRFYVKATATVSDGTTSISTTALAREPETKKGMDDSQITGTASSYARKYALNGLFCIDDTKDADTKDNSQYQPKKEVINAIHKIADIESLNAYYKSLPKEFKTPDIIDECKKRKDEIIKEAEFYKELNETTK